MNGFKLAVAFPGSMPNPDSWKNLLRRAVLWLGTGWQVTGPEDANLLLIWSDGGEEALALWRHHGERLSPDGLIACGTAAPPPEARWRLAQPDLAPPTLLSLVLVLLRLKEITGDLDLGPDGDVLDPERHLQGLIREARADGAGRHCVILGQPDLYLLPEQNACYFGGEFERLIAYCTADRDHIKTTRVSEAELSGKLSYADFSSRLSQYAVGADFHFLDAMAGPKPARHDLDELLWFSTLVNSRGRLLAGCHYGDILHVAHWPEFLERPGYGEFMKIRQLLAEKRLSLFDLAAEGDLPLRLLIDFRNACTLAKLFETTVAEPAVARPPAGQDSPIAAAEEFTIEPVSALVWDGRPAAAVEPAGSFTAPPVPAGESPAASPATDLFAKPFFEPGTDFDPDGAAAAILPVAGISGGWQAAPEAAAGELYRLFEPVAKSRKGGITIVIAGPMGAGKTAAIATLESLSEPLPAPRDQPPSATAGLNFSEIIAGDLKIFLYGIPGLRRLEFLGPSLCATAWGLVILLDNIAPDPLNDLKYYLALYKPAWARLHSAIGVTHYLDSQTTRIEDYRNILLSHGMRSPVVALDPANPAEMVGFLRVLAG